MPVSESERHERVEVMLAALRSEGFRNTNQRLAIIREIASSEEHPDAERVYEAVRRRVPGVSIDTVYRTLGTLAELGVIKRVALTPGPTRYDGNTAEHHHFICTRCGLVRDLERETFVVDPRDTFGGYGTVESLEVQARGICSACTRREARRTTA